MNRRQLLETVLVGALIAGLLGVSATAAVPAMNAQADEVESGPASAVETLEVAEPVSVTVELPGEEDVDYNVAVRSLEIGDFRVAVNADYARPGEIVVVSVTGRAAAANTATATSDVGFTPNFFRTGETSQVALLPVSVYTGAGNHWVEVQCGENAARLVFNTRERQFEVQHLTVAESTAEETILSQQANDEYERIIAPLRTVADDKQYWSGRFILPTSDERVTSSFGVVRYVNGSSTPTRHNALDFAVPQGTPVKASGAGRVLYAGFLQLTGNTVLIEHGYGLKTWYYHMNTLSVETNQMVAQADIIGTVGSTGFSTGPHMHFAMSVNNVFVNPYTMINTDLLVNDFDNVAAVSLRTVNGSYPASQSSIKVVLTNNTSQDVAYGRGYRIDRYADGKWSKVPLTFDYTDEAVTLKAGENVTLTYSLYQSQYNYQPGSYRIRLLSEPYPVAQFTLTA